MKLSKILPGFFGFFVLSLIAFSISPTYAAADALKRLSDADLIRVRAYYKGRILTIDVDYVNRDKDLYVKWKKGSVTCEYKVYSDESKKTEIASGRKKLKRHNQDFYVDIPSKFDGQHENGFFECECKVGSRKLYAVDDFSFD